MPRPQAGTRGTGRSGTLQTVLLGVRDTRAGRLSDKIVINCPGDMVGRAANLGSWEYSVGGDDGGTREVTEENDPGSGPWKEVYLPG